MQRQLDGKRQIYVGLRAQYYTIFGTIFAVMLAGLIGWLSTMEVPAVFDQAKAIFDQSVAISNVALDTRTVTTLRDNFQRGLEIAIQQNVARLGTSVAIVYLIVSVLMIGLAVNYAHRNITLLTHAAREIARGHFDVDLSALYRGRFQSEISELARAVEESGRAQLREQKLKREVSQLKIEIDALRRSSEVHSIVDSDEFKELKQKADELRQHRDDQT